MDMKGSPIWDVPLEEISLFVFGNEARGVPQEFSQRFQRFSIPGSGKVESLNLSVTATTLMFELDRQRKQ